MDIPTKSIVKSNPIKVKSKELDILEESYHDVIELLYEYFKEKKINEIMQNEIMQLIDEVYAEKKANMFINKKLKRFNVYLMKLLELSLSDLSKEKNIEEQVTQLYYKRFITNAEY